MVSLGMKVWSSVRNCQEPLVGDFMLSLGMKAWSFVLNWWEPPVGDDKKLKLKNNWIPTAQQLALWNFKALYATFNRMNATKFRSISMCKSTKEACNILKTMYEGTTTIKMPKIQKIDKRFRKSNQKMMSLSMTFMVN